MVVVVVTEGTAAQKKTAKGQRIEISQPLDFVHKAHIGVENLDVRWPLPCAATVCVHVLVCRA